MRIDQLFQQGSPTVSFEFFPPKSEEGFSSLYRTIEELRSLRPSYVSVTYGAGGSTRAKTVELTERVQQELGVRGMSHLTCVGHTREEIAAILDDLWDKGVRNVLALRGDPPAGSAHFTPTPGGFAFSQELVQFIRHRHDFCIAVAGYPEGHPACLNLIRDAEHLKAKLDAGGDFIITQLFFDNEDFYRWRDRIRRMGVRAPVVAGIMPIGNVGQIKRFVSMCGAKIQHGLLVQLEALDGDAAAVYRAGVDYAVGQCQDLLRHGVEGLHFYTLNKSRATVEIVGSLGLAVATT